MSLKKFKQINYKKILIFFLFFLLGVVAGYLVLSPSYALYEEKKNFDVINGTVEDPGDIYFAYYVDGVISRNMPLQNTGYTLDETKSNCNNGVVPTWDNAGWKFIGDYHNYSATTNTRTKCTLYFNKTAKTIKTALGNIEVNSYTPDFTKSACDDSLCESHEKGIYETTDNDGKPTYYYRGSVENNYVKFAGYFWRIIRINSNGSIRMIYDGTSAHANGEASTDRQYGTSQFNPSSNNNMYVGYMYTEGETHGTGTSSKIKTNVDKFYTDKLSSYASKLDTNVGFCGDRRTILTSNNNNAGINNNDTIFEGYKRVVQSNPDLSCMNDDYYTISSANIGNRSLKYNIGLITVDELMLSGSGGGMFEGVLNIQPKSLNIYTSGTNFWTITPVSGTFIIGDGYWSTSLFLNGGVGQINDWTCTATVGIKPVVNICSDVTITGTGTKTDPYIVN